MLESAGCYQGLLWLWGQNQYCVLQEFAMGLFVLLAGSTGICEPGDDAFHSKPAGAARVGKQSLPKTAYEVCR